MKVPHRKSVILLEIFLILILFIYFIFLKNTKDTQVNLILENYLEKEKKHLRYMNYLIGIRQKYYFEHNEIQKAIELFKRATETKNIREKGRLRKKIYYTLLPLYQAFKKEGNRGIQFHTKDGKCFLRMHIPEKFGDDLTSIRPSITYVEKHLKTLVRI